MTAFDFRVTGTLEAADFSSAQELGQEVASLIRASALGGSLSNVKIATEPQAALDDRVEASARDLGVNL